LKTVNESVKTLTGEKEKLETTGKEMKAENDKHSAALFVIKKENIYNDVVEEMVNEKDSKFSKDYVTGDFYKDNISAIEFDLEKEDVFKEAVKAKLKARQEDIQKFVKDATKVPEKKDEVVTEEQKAKNLLVTPVGKFFNKDVNSDNGKSKVTGESVANILK